MICPRCNNPAQENERFCRVCGMQLPTSQLQRPAAPQYVPASPASSVITNPVPGYGAVRLQPQTKHRPVALGIAGFAMSFGALALGLLAILFASFTNLVYMFDLDMDDVFEDLFYGYSSAYVVVALVLGVLSIVFGAVAIFKVNNEPDKYMGKGMYVSSLVLGIVSTVFALLAVTF